VLVLAGSLAAASPDVHPVLATVSAAAGAVVGDSLWYLSGRLGWNGPVALYCRWRRDAEGCLERARGYLRRFGVLTFVAARFVAGIRLLTAPLASSSGIGWAPFLAADFAGALVWAGLFVGLGYVLGEHWQTATQGWEATTLAIGGGLLASGLLGVRVWRGARRRRARRADTPASTPGATGGDAAPARDEADGRGGGAAAPPSRASSGSTAPRPSVTRVR
jgi:membrane protein DedA with SNARE-associated domain